MKVRLTLTILLVCSLFYLKSTFAQNEIEKYKQPELIEGSNLYLTFHPGYHYDNRNDSLKSSYVHISINLDFYKWKLTRKIDYSIHVNAHGYFDWNKYNNSSNIDTSYTSSNGGSYGEGGISYYFTKNLFYSGLYTNFNAGSGSGRKPLYNINIFPFIGLGRLENARQIIYTRNFEQVLFDEGVIKNKLPVAVSRKLTVLLDKRHNDEFISKYHDDADIEFFSQIEKLLLDEKIIEHSFDARTTLKLYQALTNSTYVYFPRYKGFSAQLEFNYHNISSYETRTFENALIMLVSGVYGFPIGYKTNFVFSGFAGMPVSDSQASYIDYSFYHSPQIIREQYSDYAPAVYYLSGIRKYNYVAGVKMLTYYNLSSTSGIYGRFQYSNGFVNKEKTDYSITAYLEFSYNILSRLLFTSYIEFYKVQTPYSSFDAGFNVNYILF